MALGLPLAVITARSRAMSDTIGVVALGMQTLPNLHRRWGTGN